MSDILNPLGGRFVGPSGPVAATSVLGTVPDPPRGLRQVDPGTIIKGVVLGRESDGLTAIATDKGTVRVAANIPLPPGAQVTLEVRPTGDRLQVLILSNDAARSAAPAGTTAAPSAPSQTASASSGTSSTMVGSGDARPATTQPAPGQSPTPPRAEPSIEFVGSSQRAVVVQAPPLAVPGASPPVTSPPVASPPVAPPTAAPAPPPLPPAQAPTPQVQAPPTTPPVAAQPGPAIPAPIPVPPLQAGPTIQPPPTQADVPPPASPPASAPPVNLPPAPPQSTPPPTPPPVTTLPPTDGTTPLPTSPVVIGTPAPIIVAPGAAAVVSAATVQAALLAAGAEKKDKPASALPVVTTQIAAIAELEGADSSALNDTPEQGQARATTAGLPPLESALTADAKQRILALFAAANTDAGLDVEEIKPVNARSATAGAPLPLGAELKLRVLAVQMQAGQQISIDPIALDPHDAGRQIIFGRVVSVTPAGHAVIHTPLGDIMLQNRSALVPGAQLALAIDTLDAPAPAVPPTPVVQTPQQALLTLSQGWPTLADIVSLLQGTNPDLTRAAIDADTAHQALAMLPHAGARLGAGIMGAMAALRSGDLAKLIGPLLVAKGLGGDRDEMVKRLKGEFAQLSALAQDRPEVDWRALFLPVIDDQGRVTQVNLFYRRAKKNEADPNDRGSGTRFVVEADFSRLGPFQLDGLMRPQRFDLMVRSQQRLTDRMRREIEAIYEEARGLTGFAGSIAFQTVNEFPVIPLDDLKKGNPTYTV